MEAAATQTAEMYQTAQSFRWIRALGEDIVLRQQVVLTLHHLGNDNKHWVSLIIDGKHQTMHYGNSYGTEVPPDLVKAYQWWLLQHGATPFTIKALPITAQSPDDTSSCGFLANNSLKHFAFPNTVPLIASSGIKATRMKTFIQNAGKVLDQIAQAASAVAAAGSTENKTSEDNSSDDSTPFMIERDAKFTFRVPSASSSPSDITELGNIHGLKRAKGHLDGPIITPGNSPQKKHVWADMGGRKDLPPLLGT
ncbi:hypothetical protein M405DRAFT_870581 [Rhizopogon salebrosus TDB-379]|nr:hypothetical protein M405DRAFT_870581 [Rhizopogon salebrosus TDB-379]